MRWFNNWTSFSTGSSWLWSSKCTIEIFMIHMGKLFIVFDLCIPLCTIYFIYIWFVIEIFKVKKYLFYFSAVGIRQYNLNIWPGYITAVDRYEGRRSQCVKWAIPKPHLAQTYDGKIFLLLWFEKISLLVTVLTR